MNRRTLIVIAICALSCVPLAAQTLDRERITGEWICREATILSTEEIPQNVKLKVEGVRKSFVNAIFKFERNGIFKLAFPKNSAAELNQMSLLNNKKWFFYPKESIISIGLPQENLMQMIVKQKEGVTTFLLSETPLSLRMDKIPGT